MEYTSKDEVAVCNLASISLPRFVGKDKKFDYEKLHEISKQVCLNLNRVIDANYYPVPEAEYSNMKNRPIGIGVQGLADAYMRMGIPFESEEAELTNKMIFETIYHGACERSMEIAKTDGHYESFPGSPMSQGKFQFDLWNVKTVTDRYDWDALRTEIKEHGVRNSLMLAPMPTASTSQILRNNESFEPYTSNLYNRRVLAGEFMCINPHLVNDLIDRDLWTSDVKTQLVAYNGSVQKIAQVPDDLKLLYKTVWEIPQKTLINLAIGRGPYICQSQSLNVYMETPSFAKITSMHFYGWKNGLKTGQYYLRTKAAADAIKFTLNVETLLSAVDEKDHDSVMKFINTENPDMAKKRVQGRKKKVMRKRTEKKEAPKEEKTVEVSAENMACPRRRPDEEGPCDMCSG